jgi:hypothetical protein
VVSTSSSKSTIESARARNSPGTIGGSGNVGKSTACAGGGAELCLPGGGGGRVMITLGGNVIGLPVGFTEGPGTTERA